MLKSEEPKAWASNRPVYWKEKHIRAEGFVERLVWAFGRHVNHTVNNLGEAFMASGYDLIPYSMVVPRWRKLPSILGTLRVQGGRLVGFSSLHPRTYRHLRVPKQLFDVPVFVFGDAILSTAPHFFYQDLDYATILRYRLRGEPTFMYDHVPMDLLERQRDAQWERYQKATTVFAMSRWVAKSIAASGAIPASRVRIVGAGSNLGRGWHKNPYTEANAHSRTLLFVGRDFDRKGGPLLLEAWADVRRAVAGARLVIIGPPARKHLPDCGIEWVGPAGAEEVAHWMTRAAGFVLPSLWEPFGIAFLEAMSAGLPVIGLDRMAIPEFVSHGHNGLLVKRPDRVELADAMVRVLSTPGFALEMSRSAFESARHHRWQRVAAEMMAVMQDGEGHRSDGTGAY